MTTAILDGNAIHSPGDFHRQIARQLAFPGYYGNNIAALWDVLTVDVARPVHVVWRNSAVSKRQLGEDVFERIVAVMHKVEELDYARPEAQRFTLELA
jgi:ribonuclease inhibitor